MSEKDKYFIKRYEELLDKGYCDCNEMNCIDNNSPRRILNIVKDLQHQLQQKEDIIKEVREYVKDYLETLNNGADNGALYAYLGTLLQKLEKILEILDKEGNSNE